MEKTKNIHKKWEKFVLILPSQYLFGRLLFIFNLSKVPHALAFSVADFRLSIFVTEMMSSCELWTPEPDQMLTQLKGSFGINQDLVTVFKKEEDNMNKLSLSGNYFVYDTLSENFDFIEKSLNKPITRHSIPQRERVQRNSCSLEAHTDRSN